MNKNSKSSRNKKILIIILVAFLFLGLSVFGAYKVLSPVRTTIYVFNNNYSAGTQVTGNMLTAVEVDSSIVVNGKKTAASSYYVTSDNYSSIISSAGVLRADVNAGTALMSSMLTTTGGNAIEMRMKKNAVAVSIAVNSVTGVTNTLSAGSRVNVYASYGESTTLLLQNMRILSVSTKDGSLNAVTLEVDINDSMRLIYACTHSNGIYLGLVDATGYQYVESNTYSYSLSGFHN